MKRSPIRRRTPLRRANPNRRRQRFARAFNSEAFVAFTRMQPCAVCGERGPSECAHTRSRGAGGRWTDVVALCRRCHRRSHELGTDTFQALTNTNLTRLAREHHERWLYYEARGGAAWRQMM